MPSALSATSALSALSALLAVRADFFLPPRIHPRARPVSAPFQCAHKMSRGRASLHSSCRGNTQLNSRH